MSYVVYLLPVSILLIIVMIGVLAYAYFHGKGKQVNPLNITLNPKNAKYKAISMTGSGTSFNGEVTKIETYGDYATIHIIDKDVGNIKLEPVGIENVRSPDTWNIITGLVTLYFNIDATNRVKGWDESRYEIIKNRMNELYIAKEEGKQDMIDSVSKANEFQEFLAGKTNKTEETSRNAIDNM